MTKASLLALMSLCAASGALAAGNAPAKKTTTGSAPAAQKKESVVSAADRNISGQGYGMSGCGLGSILFGQQKGFVQIFAATTNGTFGTQTFGISTGTSNCAPDDKKYASLDLYVAANKEALQKDVARGEGETLAALAQVMGCEGQSATHQVGRKLQAQYESVFSSSEDKKISSQIRNVVSNDAELSQVCSAT